ncbi:DUF308 domain-containing protein [Luteimonas sp. BDR2-5]|uniref:HdeD family acid-resistance protein n=1 Tax=Proluteimonas luteida TaxID=2878685 RepID=UPI001E653271|nr:DUF308 domain-containing protein [Luteimonas sp. BDR2-5]MCD9028752.1 DUF308 domain-containing protein [Luteimonas sp. BDR2-5]
MGNWLADGVSRAWWVFLLYGLIGVAFGVTLLVWPDSSVLALVWAFGILSLADGLVSLLSVFQRDLALPRWLLLLYALVSIAFGVLAILQPAEMAAALLWVLALWLIIAGIARIVFAIQVRKLVQGEWLLVLSGILAILLGVLFFANPDISLRVIAIWIGIGALLYGALQIAVALRLRGHARALS